MLVGALVYRTMHLNLYVQKNEKYQFLRKFIKMEILSMYRRRINFILEE